MGWLSKITSFVSNLFTAFDTALKTAFRAMMNHLYALVLPLIVIAKLVYDFVRAVIDKVVDLIQSLGDGFHGAIGNLPELISFCNYFFPIDECLWALGALFTFFIVCQIIATLRGVAQTVGSIK